MIALEMVGFYASIDNLGKSSQVTRRRGTIHVQHDKRITAASRMESQLVVYTQVKAAFVATWCEVGRSS